MPFWLFQLNHRPHVLIKRILIPATVNPLLANNQVRNTYLPPAFIDSKRFEKIQTTFPVINTMYQEYAKENHVPGYVFAIILDCRVVYFDQGGYANIEKKVLANPQTMFRIASIREMHQAWRFNMLNTQSIVNGEQCATISAYSYGLRWGHDCQNKTYVGHSGGLPGFGRNWLILPEYGIGVIFLLM